MAFESTFSVAVVWAGTQTTDTIKTSERTSGSPTKPGARRAGNSNRNGEQDFTGWEDSRWFVATREPGDASGAS